MRIVIQRMTGMLLAGAVLWALAAGAAFGQMPAGERQNLIDIYHATGGDDWHNNDGWLGAPGSECQWHGVECWGTGRVRYLWLFDNGLTGTVPAALFGFQWLQYARLDGNDLGGPLPHQLPAGGLANLRLTGNRIEGPLPASWGQRTDLYELYLSSNAITGSIPESWAGMSSLRRLDLSNNLLDGDIPDSLSDMTSLTRLDLSNNLIDGDISTLFAMPALEWLDLSHNLIDSLPESMHAVLSPSQRLEMRDNRLSGDLPEWWHRLSLRNLDLGRNELSGTIDRVLEAMTREQRVTVRIDDNQFEGPLPESLLELSFWSGFSDFCWNRFADLDPDLLAIIDAAQDGRNLMACTLREFVDLGPEISGSWFYPERAGEGYSLMLLDNGALMAYWFGYPQPGSGIGLPQLPGPSEQEWFFGVDKADGQQAIIERMNRTESGRFGEGLGEDGWVRPTSIFHDIRTVVDDRLLIYTSWPHVFYGVIASPPPPPITDRQDFLRLSELAGTRCDNQHAGQWISGAWYDPNRSGEGFIVEIHGSGQGLVYWFTHTPDDTGHHAWMMGSGTLEGSSLAFDELHQPVGGGFRPNFDTEAVELRTWGSLVMEFDDDLNGHVWFDSVDEDYGSGDYPIERLARPMLAECE